MILDEVHFTFGDFQSRKYDMIFAHLNTQDFVGNNDIMYGELTSNHIYNRRMRSHSYVGDDYTDGIAQFEIELFNDCGKAFTQEQRREIETSLFRPKKFQPLFIDMEDDTFGDTYEMINGSIKRNILMCRFVNPKRIKDSSDLTIGYSVTLETDSTMMWQEPTKYTGVPSNKKLTMTVHVDTDMDGYTYPVINVNGNSGEWTFVNKTDNPERKTVIKYNGDIIVDSTISYVTQDAYSEFTTKYFPRLVNGDNQIEITGDFQLIELTFQNRRYF